MKPYLLFIAACLLISCSKKNEPAKTDYRITTSGEVNTRQDTSLDLDLAITQLAGPKEEIKLSLQGLPDKVGYKFSTDKGTPDFHSVLSLSIGYAAQPGHHNLKLVGTTASGVSKEFPFALNIDTVGDCRNKLAGAYSKTSENCNGWSDGDEATIAIDPAKPNHLLISNLLGSSAESFRVECEHKIITVDHAAGYYKITGKGSISNNTIQFDLSYTPVVEPTPQGPHAFNCKVTLVKK